MKLKEMAADQWPAHLQFLRNHGELLRSYLKSAGDQAQHYLLFSTGGAIAAMLSLMGASAPIRHNPIAFTALKCYVLGLLLSGCLAAVNYQLAKDQFERWLDDIEKFAKNETDHTAIFENINRSISRFGRLAALFGYGAFLCLVVGSIVAIYGLTPRD
jgi:hypothetical protein